MEIVQTILLATIAVLLGLIYNELLDAIHDPRRKVNQERGLTALLSQVQIEPTPAMLGGRPTSERQTLPVRMTPSEFADASRAENIRIKREEAKENANV